MERVSVFIDGSNFYFALKRNNRATRVDYHELSKALAGPDRKLVRTFYYNSAYDPVTAPEQSKAQQPFLDSLDRTPYLELRLGRLHPLSLGGYKEKGTDVLLSGDLVYHAARNLFDTAIIYTEDSDFAYSINKAKELGKHVEICSFADSQQRDLIREGDSFIHLDKVLEKYAEKIFPQEIKSNVVNLPAEKKIVEKKPEEPPVKRPRGRPKTKGILDGLKKIIEG